MRPELVARKIDLVSTLVQTPKGDLLYTPFLRERKALYHYHASGKILSIRITDLALCLPNLHT